MTISKIGKYTISGELGRGAMGIVYKGLDPMIGRAVAIKTIRFDLSSRDSEQENVRKRFMREAQSAGSLSHPNIVTIYEVGEDQGVTYIAMQHVEGNSLDELICSGKKFSVAEVADLMAQIGDALDYAHEMGIVHRDIKPANMLVDKNGKPHIVDFGIARVSTSTMTQTSLAMGTPYYMSPEQISGQKVDSRTDVFSLGAVIYELLTQKKPFPGENITTVIYRIINEQAIPVEQLRKDLPADLDRIIQKALAKDPDSRYRNCRELVKDLKQNTRFSGETKGEHEKRSIAASPAKPGRKDAVWRAQPPLREVRSRKPLLVVLAAMMVVVAVVVGSALIYTSRNRNTELAAGSSLQPSLPLEKPARGEAGNPPLPLEKPAPTEMIEASPPLETEETEVTQVEKQEMIQPEASVPDPPVKPQKGEGKKEISEPEATKIEVIETKIPPSHDLPKEKPVDVSRLLSQGINAFNDEKYPECIAKMEEVLLSQPENRYARYYLNLANKRWEESQKPKPVEVKAEKKVDKEWEEDTLNTRAQSIFEAARADFQAGRYHQAITQFNHVLELDRAHSDARKYLHTAHLKIAPGELESLVKAYIQAVKSKSLNIFYRNACSPGLYQKIRKDTDLLLNLYDDFQTLAENIQTNVNNIEDNYYRADVSFAHIMTGLSRAKGVREVLFEGELIWVVEKKNSTWLITDIKYVDHSQIKFPE